MRWRRRRGVIRFWGIIAHRCPPPVSLFVSTEGGFCMVRRDDCLIFLAQKTKDVDLTNRAARAVDDDWCNYDLHFHCQPGTLDALYREFREKGVAIPESYKDGPVTRCYGIRDFSVCDPDGYDLVFGEECLHEDSND